LRALQDVFVEGLKKINENTKLRYRYPGQESNTTPPSLHTASEIHPSSYTVDTVVKRDEVNNGGAIPPLLHISLWRGA
jgi:hypothetical protein